MNTATQNIASLKSIARSLAYAVAFTAAVAVPEVMAQEGLADTSEKVCGFFSQITGLLGMASIAVVTIAVMFAGYQIAFANKRISDVSTILIGGLLIGAAGQIASMVLGDGAQECTPGNTFALVQQTVQFHRA
mgnify:CR=1 FL=1